MLDKQLSYEAVKTGVSDVWGGWNIRRQLEQVCPDIPLNAAWLGAGVCGLQPPAPPTTTIPSQQRVQVSAPLLATDRFPPEGAGLAAVVGRRPHQGDAGQLVPVQDLVLRHAVPEVGAGLAPLDDGDLRLEVEGGDGGQQQGEEQRPRHRNSLSPRALTLYSCPLLSSHHCPSACLLEFYWCPGSHV